MCPDSDCIRVFRRFNNAHTRLQAGNHKSSGLVRANTMSHSTEISLVTNGYHLINKWFTVTIQQSSFQTAGFVQLYIAKSQWLGSLGFLSDGR